MRCYCCDKALAEKEIVWNDDLKSFDMCSECLEISLDAAYSDGFQPDDDSHILVDETYTEGDASDIIPRWTGEEA